MGTPDEDYLASLGGGYAPEFAPAGMDPLMAQKAANDARIRAALGGANRNLTERAGLLGEGAPGIEGATSLAGALLSPAGALGSAFRHPEAAQRAIEVAPSAGATLPGGGFAPGRLPTVKATGTLVPSDASRALGATSVSPMTPDMNPEVDVRPAPTLAERAGAQAPGGYGGGGGGIGRGRLNAAEAGELDALGRGAGLDRLLGQQRTDVETEMAPRYAEAADAKIIDAELQAQRDADANKRHETFMYRQEKLADDLATKRLDPSRLLRNADFQTQFTIGLGSALAQGLAAMNGQTGNSSLDRLDKIIDRDVEAQKSEIQSGVDSYNARNSLFGKMLEEHKDANLAATATRALLYQGTAEKLKADADRLGIPQIKTTAEQAANLFEQKAAGLNRQFAAEAYKLAVQQAAAAQAARIAAEEKAYQRQKDLEELKYKYAALDVAAGKGSGGKDKEHETAQAELNAGLKEIAEAKKNIGSVTAGTQFGAGVAGLPTWVPGATTARMNVRSRDDWNIRAKMLVGAAYKLGTDSQEPKRMELIDEYAKPFVIKADDNEEVARAKMDGLAHLLTIKSAAKGAEPQGAPNFRPDSEPGGGPSNPWQKPLSDQERKDAMVRNMVQSRK